MKIYVIQFETFNTTWNLNPIILGTFTLNLKVEL
jgi:hypothetical protein